MVFARKTSNDVTLLLKPSAGGAFNRKQHKQEYDVVFSYVVFIII